MRVFIGIVNLVARPIMGGAVLVERVATGVSEVAGYHNSVTNGKGIAFSGIDLVF